MIKKYSIVSIFILFVTVTFAQEKYTCAEMGLKGNVKTITETKYKLNDINPGLNEVLNITFQFNKNCQKTSEITTEIGGDTKIKHAITYDKAGKITSEVKQNKDVNGNFTIRYKYNTDKTLKQKELVAGGKVLSTYIYAYDDKGNVSGMDIKKKLGLLDINNETFTYKYDDKNRLIEELHMDGEAYNKIEYVYNDKDQLTRRVEYNQRGGITYETDYEYDELDNLSAETSKYRGNSTHNISYVYEYDAQGNWINKRSLADNRTFELQIRIISYYK